MVEKQGALVDLNQAFSHTSSAPFLSELFLRSQMPELVSHSNAHSKYSFSLIFSCHLKSALSLLEVSLSGKPPPFSMEHGKCTDIMGHSQLLPRATTLNKRRPGLRVGLRSMSPLIPMPSHREVTPVPS